jgi:hypothetical protein
VNGISLIPGNGNAPSSSLSSSSGSGSGGGVTPLTRVGQILELAGRPVTIGFIEPEIDPSGPVGGYEGAQSSAEV